VKQNNKEVVFPTVKRDVKAKNHLPLHFPFMSGNDDIFSHRDSKEGPKGTSTHQWTNVDGWCTHRTLFSIPVPSQVDFFSLPFLSPDLSFILELYFLSLTDLLTYIFKLKKTLPHLPTHL
jgi:hypothetical protein